MSLYVSQQKSELLDSLENQVRFSQLVAILVGARGLGKSFLLEQLHRRLKDEVSIASVDASMAMSDDQLDKTISLQLGLSWQESNSDLATRITNTHSEKVLISIDNAHLLSASCLEFILKLNQSQLAEKDTSLFILLAGENSLPVMINRTPTFTRHPEMCVVFEVEAIQQSETRAIVETFSHPNSEVLKELKNGSKLDYFWQLAKGNPAELNYHMSRWLDEHSPTQVVEINSKTQPRTILKAVTYSLLAILLSSMLVYQDEINQWISPTETDPAKTEDAKTGEGSQLSKVAVIKENKDENDLNPNDLDTSKSAKQEGDSQELAKQFESELAKEQQKNYLQPEDDSLELSTIENDQITPDKTRKTKQANTDDSISKQNTTVKKSPEPKVDLKANTQLNKPSNELTKEELTLLNTNGSFFLLQWAGVSSRTAADKYRESHLAKSQMKIYRRSSNGKTLYIIVSDEFSNRALAEFALNNYIQQGINERPWIKSLGLVQKEINQFEASLE